jgi:hypothetical protein
MKKRHRHTWGKRVGFTDFGVPSGYQVECDCGATKRVRYAAVHREVVTSPNGKVRVKYGKS